MQPAVTSAKVTFDLPRSIDVQNVPENVPPMFIGERTIVYGIFTQPPDKSKTSTEGSIIVSGDLLGAKIEHKVNFKIPVPVPKDDHTVTTIHYLAAKKLIKEMEEKNSERDNNEIVKLSCESNVMSSLTGFIAIDEDQQEPVKGSVQIWDIQAPPPEQRMYMRLSQSLYSQRLNTYGAKSLPERPFLSSKKTKGKGGKGGKGKILKDRCRKETSEVASCGMSHQSVECSSNFAQPSLLKENLPTVISLQMANGAWRLTAELAAVVGKTVDDVKQFCPIPCDGEMEVIWATVLALSYLQQKETAAKEEWELIAVKAEIWLQKQSLPDGSLIESLRQKAIALLN